MDEPSRWVLAPIESGRLQKPETPFRVAGSLFVPLQRGQLVAGERRKVCFMSYGDSPYGEFGQWELRTQLADQGGRPHRLAAFELASETWDADLMRRTVVWIQAGDLLPGEYRLRVQLADRETGRSAEASAPLDVPLR